MCGQHDRNHDISHIDDEHGDDAVEAPEVVLTDAAIEEATVMVHLFNADSAVSTVFDGCISGRARFVERERLNAPATQLKLFDVWRERN